MAGDWIKMRSDLFTHPKVVRITSALKADRLRTVGGLMSVWCLFDAHSIDGRLEGYTLETVDELIGWAGFADAMKNVGWLDEDCEGLVLPEFGTHNGQSAKRRAQDSDRKRAERLSASDADKNGTREEKRREEKREAKSKALRAQRFDPQAYLETLCVDSIVARDWITHRKAKRAAPTQTAIDGINREAEKAGLSLQAALKISCQRGWQGFEAEWMKGSQGPPRAQSWSEKNDEVIAQLTGRSRGYEPDDRTIDI